MKLLTFAEARNKRLSDIHFQYNGLNGCPVMADNSCPLAKIVKELFVPEDPDKCEFWFAYVGFQALAQSLSTYEVSHQMLKDSDGSPYMHIYCRRGLSTPQGQLDTDLQCPRDEKQEIGDHMVVIEVD